MAFLKKSLFLVLFLGLVSLSICEEENREEEREENEPDNSEEGNEEEAEDTKEKRDKERPICSNTFRGRKCG
uniref:Dissulfin-01 n=1 Tax=Boana raniceps TaxID=192750 RepID=A0A2L2DDG4_BOARA|nr:dissulfin-01 precursor [Boana raniceps]